MLLRIPPFHGSKIHGFAPLPSAPADDAELRHCAALMRQHRVCGSYWAAQPIVPNGRCIVRSAAASAHVAELCEPLLWLRAGSRDRGIGSALVGDCDPWHVLAGARALVTEPGDEIAVVGALLNLPTYTFDPKTKSLLPEDRDIAVRLREQLPAVSFFTDPFTGDPIGLAEAIELCGFWRRLVDSNRDIAGGLGFAFWKQSTVAPLLWSGGEFRFFRDPPPELPAPAVAVWRAKAPARVVAALQRRGTELIEVEDGFLRSAGLGADCVPPLSITVDRLGAHFDPAAPSELEQLLQDGEFDPALIARARQLRETIVAEGLGKYGRDTTRLPRPGGAKRHILVPGQVEDDRSVMTGGCGLTSNLELLRRVRAREPEAFILYKPHPDVIAGHRTGDIPDQVCLQSADIIAADAPIPALLDMADAVHVNTSLAGFEALMRGKEVTTHGVPFYAGWGLTTDLGPVPPRRSARRTLDELVAATLLLYPRYLDPVTGLPCPAETVVRRLCAGGRNRAGLLPAVRRLQGRIKRSLRVLVS